MANSSSLTLCIDTSGSFCSVCVFENPDTPLASVASSGDGDHFEQLPRLVRDVADRATISLNELAEVRVGVGPGSFTGVRIGMSFAKGLAWACSVPLIGCSSFESLARRVVANATAGEEPIDSIAVVANAGRKELFLGAYAVEDGRVVCMWQPSLVAVSQIERGEVMFQPSTRWYTPARDFAETVPVIDSTGSKISVSHVADVALGMAGCKGVAASGSALLAALEPTYIREVAAKSLVERGIVLPKEV